MVLTDPRLAGSEAVSTTLEWLCNEGIDAVLYDQVHVEPTDRSFKHAIEFAADGNFDGFVAVGGGSTMDTAKAANLSATLSPPISWPMSTRPSAEGSLCLEKQSH